MEEWIRCPHCGHKLMLLKQKGRGSAPKIEIKCSSCKRVSDPDGSILMNDDPFSFIDKKQPPDEV